MSPQEAEQRRLEQRMPPKREVRAVQDTPPPLHHSVTVPRLETYTAPLDPVSSVSTSRLSMEYPLNRALEPHLRAASSDHLSRSGHQSDNYSRGGQHSDQYTSHQPPVEPPVNRTSDPNFWRNQATTYQPLQAPLGGQDTKPLPDAIINSITQRVKSRPGSANNSSGR